MPDKRIGRSLLIYRAFVPFEGYAVSLLRLTGQDQNFA